MSDLDWANTFRLPYWNFINPIAAQGKRAWPPTTVVGSSMCSSLDTSVESRPRTHPVHNCRSGVGTVLPVGWLGGTCAGRPRVHVPGSRRCRCDRPSASPRALARPAERHIAALLGRVRLPWCRHPGGPRALDSGNLHAVVVDGSSMALDDSETQRAVDEYRLHARRMLLGGSAGIVVAIVIVTIANGEPGVGANVMALAGLGVGPVAALAGTSGSLRAWRLRRLLRSVPWRVAAGSYRIAPWGPNGQPVLVLRENGSDAETLMSVPTTVWRYRRLHTGADGALLLARSGRRWAAAAPPDRSVVVVVKEPWLPWHRSLLRRAAGAMGE
jgi:hypothetical protein